MDTPYTDAPLPEHAALLCQINAQREEIKNLRSRKHHLQVPWQPQRPMIPHQPVIYVICLYMFVYGCICLYMVVYGCIWLYMFVYGCIWMYMDVYVCICLYMVVYVCMFTLGFCAGRYPLQRGSSHGSQYSVEWNQCSTRRDQ